MRRRARFALVAVVNCLAFAASATSAKTSLEDAALCPKWSEPVRQGGLDPKTIDESSGLSISRTQDSFYHMNDSGTPPVFYVTKPDGSSLRTIKIENYKPVDPEETSLGPCPLDSKKTCLVIEDIGDNLKTRKSIAFVFIEEKNPWPASVKPHLIARFKYPDGAHNAEAATLLENGDLILFTKEQSLVGEKASPALVYRARREQVLRAVHEPISLEKIGTLDVPALTGEKGLGGVVTGLAVIRSGRRFVLLTYKTALEFSIDLNQPFPKVVEPKMWRRVPLLQLPQQESIAYDRGDRDLIYSTEIKILQRFLGKGEAAPMMKVKCLP